MNQSVLHITSVSGGSGPKLYGKPVLTFSKSDFKWPLLFMLSMAMLGLNFYPGLLLTLAAMLNRMRQNPYDFAIMLMMFFHGFGMVNAGSMPVNVHLLGLVAGAGCCMVLRKPRIMKTTLIVYFIFVAVLMWLSTCSWEAIKVQAFIAARYFSFIVVFIPLAVFADKGFDIMEMVRHMMVFLVLVCLFYLIDGLILKGHILMPDLPSWTAESTFTAPVLKPFSLEPVRMYPQGLYFAAVALLPAMRLFRLPAWFWILFITVSLLTKTFTYILGIALTLLFFQGSMRRIIKICAATFIPLLLLYGIDCLLPVEKLETGENSTLRLKSSVDQFFDLYNAADDEDIAEFGSGRMAQAIPKIDLINRYHKQWTGLGFLHPEKTTSNRFIIVNEYYSDLSSNVEVATGVEVVPIQVYLHGGWIGLIAVTAFYVGLYFIIRRLRYSYFYPATLFFCGFLGLGGFAPLTNMEGIMLVAFSYALVILANRSTLPRSSPRDKATQPQPLRIP